MNARPPAEAELGETAFDHGEPRYVEIYNGRDKLGAVAIGRSIRALDAAGVELGTYPTQAEARAAVVRHAFAARPT